MSSLHLFVEVFTSTSSAPAASSATIFLHAGGLSTFSYGDKLSDRSGSAGSHSTLTLDRTPGLDIESLEGRGLRHNMLMQSKNSKWTIESTCFIPDAGFFFSVSLVHLDESLCTMDFYLFIEVRAQVKQNELHLIKVLL